MNKLRRFLREPEVIRLCGYGRSQLADLIARGEFPRPIRLSDTGRAKAWIEDPLPAACHVGAMRWKCPISLCIRSRCKAG
jgi:predicted DNA-binding transcriptional regulator AlpA